MALIKTKALVIRETPYNDTDKMLTLLTADFGKIGVSARGARRSGSRYAYGTGVFSYGEYILFKTGNSYRLNSCDVITHFYDVASDMTRFTHAAHILDVAQDVAVEQANAEGILNLLLHGLNALKKGREPGLVSSAFGLKILQITGYPPQMTKCTLCGTREMDKLTFSFRHGGLLCDGCSESDRESEEVSPGTVRAMLHVLLSEGPAVFQFGLTPEIVNSFSRIVLRFLSERLDKKYNKLEFLKEL